MSPTTRLAIYSSFINGKCINDHDTKDTLPDNHTPVVSPATNKAVLGFVPSTPQDVENAISAATEAFHATDDDTDDTASWSHHSQTSNRASILLSIANELRQNTTRLADLEVQQIGRPCKEMRFQLSRLPEWFEYYASLLRVHEESVKPFGPGYLNVTKRVALGVVVQITPFNHPLLITVKKLAPALAAGNTVVIKPSELAPASVIEFAKLCTKAGLPPGVLNVLLGGKEVGECLISDTRIVKVDFTGGPSAGKEIGRQAGANLCCVTQELGGKAPMIVMPPPGGTQLYTAEKLNEYLDPIVNGCAFGAFIASGQTCIAGTRAIVHESIYEIFKEKMVLKVKCFRMGHPECTDTTIGPVITSKQLSFMDTCVKEGLSSDLESLELLCGGKRYTAFQDEKEELNHGNWYEPTVIAVKQKSALTQEIHHNNILFQTELFGPILLLVPFSTTKEAITLANDTPYGLGCSIWTHDLVEAHSMADAVQSGIVWINDHHKNHPSSPWGGLKKESGVGRENGLDAYYEYTQTKSIVVNCNKFDSDWFKDADARYN